MSGAIRPVIVLLLALFLVACNGLGFGQGDQGTSPAPTAERPEETDEPQATVEPDETDELEATVEPDETDEPDGGGNDGETGDVSVFDLDVGMCFNVPEGGREELQTVATVPCDEGHEYEVFALVEHPGGDQDEYPGDEELDDFAFEECEGPFDEYVGTEYVESIYYINYLTPSADTWAEGDREIVCVLYLYNPEDDELIESTGSAQGSEE